MLRHEFQPGRLIVGTWVTGVGIAYAGDAAGAWRTPWFLAIPLVMGGLFLAGVVGLLNRGARRRRAACCKGTDPVG